LPARRLLLEWCAIALLAMLVTGGLVLTRGAARLDNAVYDLLVRLRAPQPSDRIIIVAIDDASLAALGQWPLPRTLHARAIERIANAGPAAIAYDILFTEPARERGADERFAAALTGRSVVLPLLIDAPGSNGAAFDVVLPVAELQATASALGHVALPLDEGGRGRGAWLWLQDGARRWPHLMEAAYRMAEGQPSRAWVRHSAGEDGFVLVPFAGSGEFRQVPFKDVVRGHVPASFFRNRIVLVGTTAAGLGDRHRLAGAGQLAGVEVQANVLNALIADRFLREASVPVQLAWAVLPSLTLLLLFWRLRPAAALQASAAALIIVATLPALLIVLGWWLPPGAALVGLLIVYPLWGWRRLQAVDHAISRELDLFITDDQAGRPAQPARLDPAGRGAAQLSSSIAALRNLKQLISDTLEGVSDPLIVTGRSGDIVLANRAGQMLVAEGALRPLLAGQAVGGDAPAVLELADGRSFSPRISPLRDAHGHAHGSILLLAEITAIRQAEREREAALEFLSHDMRAPQSAILTLLEGSAAAPLPGDLSARLAYHARRTLGLADDFVQLARLRTTAFDPRETDLGDALAEAMDALWPQASARKVRVVRLGMREPCCVLGEHDSLTRALTNLIDNAVKFSPEGAEVRCTLTRFGDRQAPWAEVSIEDRGAGVDGERLEALFERFGHTRQQGAAPSAGLGLAYVRAVAARHGGEVRHAPATPSGACFVLGLPALPDAPSEPGEDGGC
jgi:CHASE2 domain-containing sensor protein/signal transduction histidine kinase